MVRHHNGGLEGQNFIGWPRRARPDPASDRRHDDGAARGRRVPGHGGDQGRQLVKLFKNLKDKTVARLLEIHKGTIVLIKLRDCKKAISNILNSKLIYGKMILLLFSRIRDILIDRLGKVCNIFSHG